MKRALCVGINDYPGSQNDLTGCVNDAKDWHDELKRRGFDELTLLLDKLAIKSGILTELVRLIGETKNGDTLLFTFSGHGTWTPDLDGDEADGRDEALCPYDFQKDIILDDELYEAFCHRHHGARVVMISDSCHSGTVARMAAPIAGSRRRIRYMPPEHFLSGDALERAKTVERSNLKAMGKSSALLLAGCRDTEYSYDASFNGRPNGAFTYVALQALKQGPKTYSEWYKLIRTSLPSMSHPQTPQLQGTTWQRKWKVLS